ncbi:NIPSNAP family protein [Spirillospora sp. CA-294931]|uniref:NIPSNAP family protein n=1 Tax=Spirillospora sp. CA-294931 TaxID=3240042 RepID=UPI003D91714E
MASENAVLEIRTYRLHAGTRDRFDALFREFAVPLMREHGITVVDCGPSLVDEPDEPGEGYYLIRSFASLDERAAREAAFYGSDAWRLEHRDGVVALIQGDHHTVVLTSDRVACRDEDARLVP